MQMNDVFPHLAMKPRVSPQAFVAPSATVVGDVVIEEEASIWYGSVLRGDVGAIRVGTGSNIQDLCLLHVSTGGPPCEVGAWCTVGHGVILHSCCLLISKEVQPRGLQRERMVWPDRPHARVVAGWIASRIGG